MNFEKKNISIWEILTLLTTQNSQTHLNNSSAFVGELFDAFDYFGGVGA